MSVATRTGDQSPEDMRFADLIRLRDRQQEQRIEQLLQQNQLLQQQVQEAFSQRAMSNAIAAAAAAAGSDPQQAASAPAASLASLVKPTVAALPPGFLSQPTAGSDAASQAPVVDPASGVNLLAQLNDAAIQSRIETMVRAAVDDLLTQERNAHRSILDRNEQRFSDMAAQVAELQQQLKEEQRQKELMRKEHSSQHLVLSGELDHLREELEAANERNAARENALIAAQASHQKTNAALQQLEERVNDLGRLPATVESDMRSWEERLSKLASSLEADRAAASAARADSVLRQEAQLQDVIAEARAAVIRLSSDATDVHEKLAKAQTSVDEMVKQHIANVAQQLETEMLQKMEDQNERLIQMQQRQVMDHQAVQQQVAQSLADMKHSVDSSLMGMRRQYHDALQEQLRAVVQQAQEFEEKRRAECPVADADRIELMVKELQGAFTLVEAVTQRVAATPSVTDLTERLDSFEQRLESLTVYQKGIAHALAEIGGGDAESAKPLPSLSFNIGVQADTDGLGALYAAGRDRQSTVARVQQNLDEELAKAASAVQLSEARKILSQGIPRANLPPNGSPAPLPAVTSSNPPPSGSLGEVRQRMQEKEAALERLQGILRAIQLQFHQLAESEARAAGSQPAGAIPTRSNSGGAQQPSAAQAAEMRRVSEEIAKQKAAVYNHERQLVEQRNALWRDLAKLKAQEEELLAR